MVNRTLTESESKSFTRIFVNAYGKYCGGSEGATWGYGVVWRPNRNSESYFSQIYSRSVSGSWTLIPVSGWKKLSLSPNQITVKIDCTNGTVFKWRGNCDMTTPPNPPNECTKSCSITDTGVSSVNSVATNLFVPNWANSTRLKTWVTDIINGGTIKDYTFPESLRRNEINPLRLNDLMQNVTPFYVRPKSNNRKRL